MEPLIQKLQGSVNYQNHLTMVANLSATLELIKKCSMRLDDRRHNINNYPVWSPLYAFYKKQSDISARALTRLKQHYKKQLKEMIETPMI